MKLKRLLIGTGLVAVTSLTLASCGSTTRNTVTPYGKLQSSLDKNIATANGDLSLTLGEYYTKLRSTAYDVVETAINKQLYETEYKGLKLMYSTKNYDTVTDKDLIKKAFELVDDSHNFESTTPTALYEMNSEKYAELREKSLKELNQSIATSIFNTSDIEAYESKTEVDLNKSISSFIDAQAKKGVTISKEQIKIVKPSDSAYQLGEDSKVIEVSPETLALLSDLVDENLLSQAKTLSSKKALYKIADEEYITSESDENEKTKNSNYLFKDSSIESQYNTTYKTYGTYKAVIIQFNTLLEANEAIQRALGGAIVNDEATIADQYLNIYKTYYGYKTDSALSIDDEEFNFVINKNKNDFSDIPSSIATFVQSTLEDGDFLLEPRNIDNKYVLCLKLATSYDVHGDSENDEVDYDKLSDADKTKYTALIKEDLVDGSKATYSSTNNIHLIKDSKIKIYDPVFEHKFKYSYTDYYDVLTTNTTADSSTIFELGNGVYTVEEFFKEASKKYQSTIINDFFELKYANKYYDTYVNDYYIDKDLHSTNETALNDAIKAFEAGNNSSYAKEIGVENYLTLAYGYNTKENVLKYYYDATKALEVYRQKSVFTEWISEVDGKYSISDTAKNGFLNNLLATGNAEYSKLFGINLDHILINIDDDGDGSPDDPQKFIAKHPELEESFKAAVVKLAKKIYLEAISETYKDNSLYKVLSYIKTQYEQNAPLKSDPTDNWGNYKEFPFLLTVEQLASSSSITEATVSNFVKPFADYVKNIYEFAVKEGDSHASSTYTDGVFYFVYNNGTELTGKVADNADFANNITIDALCQTSFGYHMLVLNSYTVPRTPQFKEESDSTKYQANLKIVLREYTDSDDKTVTKYITTDSYNDSDKEANIKQLFIYYVQKRNGASSSLNSDMATLLGRMFDEVISTYTSTNFQNYLILKDLNIKVVDQAFADTLLSQASVDSVKTNYKNLVLGYDNDSKYASWFNDTTVWDRPDKKAE